jgi:transcription antitermination factor NusG
MIATTVNECAHLVRATGAECWYAIHSRSNFERRIAGELAAKGIETYLPSYEEVHQWKDRKKKVDIPLFSGYVFARFSDSPRRRLTVLQTSGVVRILGRGDAIEPVPDYEVEAVRLLLNSKISYFPHPFLQEGVEVRVKYGALAGLTGILIRLKSQARLVISVNLLSQSVAAEVDAQSVEMVDKARS